MEVESKKGSFIFKTFGIINILLIIFSIVVYSPDDHPISQAMGGFFVSILSAIILIIMISASIIQRRKLSIAEIVILIIYSLFLLIFFSTYF